MTKLRYPYKYILKNKQIYVFLERVTRRARYKVAYTGNEKKGHICLEN